MRPFLTTFEEPQEAAPGLAFRACSFHFPRQQRAHNRSRIVL